MPLGSSETLDIIVRTKDRASKKIDNISNEISGMQRQVKAMQPTFRRMALGGSVAFAALSAGIGFSVKEAALARGEMNKFMTVFEDRGDEMLNFIDDLRTEMPLARHEIVSMAAGLQDLMKPMGLSNDLATDMSQQFLDLANKIAVFNTEASQTDVLEALRSGIAGMSRPLRQFGIDARAGTLAVKAVEEGLVSSTKEFENLKGEARSQIRIQALLAQSIDQSADAYEGFSENIDDLNNDIFFLQASFKELKEAFGSIFREDARSFIQTITSMVEGIRDFTEANPVLVKTITTIGLVTSAVVALTGAIGIAVGTFAGLGLAFGTAGSTVFAIVLAVSALASAIIFVIDNWEQLKQQWLSGVQRMAEIAKSAFQPVLNLFKSIGNAIGTIGSAIGTGLNTIGSTIGSVVPLAEGGVVTRPTLSVVGEAGPEAVIPLSKMNQGGGDTVVVNVNGGNYLSRDAADEFSKQIGRQVKRRIRTSS